MSSSHLFYQPLQQFQTASKILKNFQDKLTQIPEWTKEDKQRLYQQIIQSSGITYLGDLIQGILGTQIKIIIKTESATARIRFIVQIP